MKHPWKIAFWACFILLIAVTCLGAFAVLDQGVTLTYLRDDHSHTEQELEILTGILNDSRLSKPKIIKVLEGYDLSDFNSDTIILDKVRLIFEQDTLIKAEKIFKDSFSTE